MKCFRCNKEIHPKDDYEIMIGMSDGGEVTRDFVHKICWDKFTQQLDGAVNSLNKSNYLLNAMGKQMRTLGFLPDEEILI